MGKPELRTNLIPVNIKTEKAINYPITLLGKQYYITCVSMGNPHCVVFDNRMDTIDIQKLGPVFESADIFPEKVNTEFVRVINKNTLKMRVYERSNGETWACGTGACAAVVAAVENGLCSKGEDITVILQGGDVIVNYTEDTVFLTGDAHLVYKGVVQY